jgi:hypothetical protein
VAEAEGSRAVGSDESESESVKLTLPLPPNLLNSRLHWRVKHAAKNRFYQTCDNLQMAKAVPAPGGPALKRARVTIRAFTHQAMDKDGLYGRMKWVLDWLVTRGYLQDDSPKHITLKVSQRIDRKRQRIEVELKGA